MVIHSSLADSLPRLLLPCAVIGCSAECRHTGEFWDRLKNEEQPQSEREREREVCQVVSEAHSGRIYFFDMYRYIDIDTFIHY